MHSSTLKVMTNGERRMFEDASVGLEAQEMLLYNTLEIPSYTKVTQECIYVLANESFQPRTLKESGYKIIRRHPNYGGEKWRSLISRETMIAI